MTRIEKPENIISVDVNDKMETAINKFKTSGKSRIIVSQNKDPIRILRVSDIVKFKPNVKIAKIVENLDSINRASPDDNIQKLIAAQDCQPVTVVFDKTNNNPVGIVTPSDVTRFVDERKQEEVQTE
ncbi:CBS domain-containing protein [Nitrosopumilus sp.]|uniref:CBS domain-containing protein n=1 Tax=Nitrosopumilus sp. TaxID=2024843 RepID=UPI003D0CA35E